ncbi:MAG: glycosyltransferase, partial [Chloroflexi bacterium]|nr:glycosyltransferase [Chloroflexota bacterium]
ARAVSLRKAGAFIPDILPSDIEDICRNPENYELEVLDAIRWIEHGTHEAMPGLIAGWDVVAITSLKESLCVAALEAQAMEVPVVATSVGLVDGMPLLDMCYEEDARAQVDFNVVMTDKGEYVELQGTAEGSPYSQDVVDGLLTLAKQGITYLLGVQRETIDSL